MAADPSSACSRTWRTRPTRIRCADTTSRFPSSKCSRTGWRRAPPPAEIRRPAYALRPTSATLIGARRPWRPRQCRRGGNSSRRKKRLKRIQRPMLTRIPGDEDCLQWTKEKEEKGKEKEKKKAKKKKKGKAMLIGECGQSSPGEGCMATTTEGTRRWTRRSMTTSKTGTSRMTSTRSTTWKIWGGMPTTSTTTMKSWPRKCTDTTKGSWTSPR
mmetsp:Transcript_13213/g.49013  ORF Transcript_13213/g.49013 Transcript_13213/m.49013 type:complete len:214 (-) Transcript_13213:1214-1855(-)